MTKFKLGQLVKQGLGTHAHYAVVIGENLTVGWTPHSTLEYKPIKGEGWRAEKPHGQEFNFPTIINNIKSFEKALKAKKSRRYNLADFNCEHWATLMITGKAYSTQSGKVIFGPSYIVGGAMIGAGASASTVVTIASTLGASASTGTAIGSLSGAAASSAAMAWLGGGAIAAGGGGVAMGTAIVTGVATGGIGLAVIGAGIIGAHLWKSRKK